MNTRLLTLVATLVFAIWMAGCSSGHSDEVAGSRFTGETLTILFVSDVRRSVEFYKSLGFKHDFFYDYEKEDYVLRWVADYPPGYAEMTQGRIRLALTTADEPGQVFGGGVRHYFLLDDVHAHFTMLDRNGITAEPHEVEERPWMDFVTVPDPDNHQIVFGTKNQAYYDAAREQIDRLER